MSANSSRENVIVDKAQQKCSGKDQSGNSILITYISSLLFPEKSQRQLGSTWTNTKQTSGLRPESKQNKCLLYQDKIKHCGHRTAVKQIHFVSGSMATIPIQINRAKTFSESTVHEKHIYLHFV